MRFVYRKHKLALLKQGQKLKGSNIFINSQITERNADIARKARSLKKAQKIQHTWVTNFKIFITLNGTSENAQVFLVRTRNRNGTDLLQRILHHEQNRTGDIRSQ